MRKATIALVAAAALGLAGLAARAQEMDPGEFLKKLEEQLYTNEGRAIAALEVDVQDSAISMFPGVGGAVVVARFYWTPARGLTIDLEGLPAGSEAVAGDIASYLEGRWLERLLVRPLTRAFDGYRLSVVRRGHRVLVEAVPVGFVPAGGVVRQTAEFDERFRPLERTMYLAGGGTIRERYQTTPVAEKILITRIDQDYEDLDGPDGTRGRFAASIAFEYGRFGAYSLPTRITVRGMGRDHSVTFQEYEIHEDIEGSVDSR